MTKPIRVLDDVSVSRIAAGEVVERPASVVKELVENSLDAGATDILVEVHDGGRRLIRVVDNGHGIPADEVALAFERHATSKIASADDLERLATLGFRGEALSSIASVCHVTLLTRAAGDDVGTRVRVDNGRLVEREPAGAPVGTSVTAENLFNAVPARLKFLSSAKTEAGHVHDLVTRYALAYPDRRFRHVRDGRTVFQSAGTGELSDVLIAAFGPDVAREMIALSTEAPETPSREGHDSAADITVGGFVSPPHVHRSTRRHITLFVNGRWVQDSSLAFAVVQAYHTLLPGGRAPIAVLMIELPHDAVDVNVHPAKTEVRFRDGRAVFAAVQRAVRRTVVGGAPVPPVGARAEPSEWPGGWTGEALPGARPAGELRVAEAEQPGLLDAPAGGLPPLRVLGQVAGAFIAAEGPDGLYLIDQHAAHERVMYEEFMARESPRPAQRLLEPATIPLTPAEMAVVENHGTAFAKLGFEIEPFGPDTVLVRALPEVLVSSEVTATVRSVLDATSAGHAPIETAFEERLVRAVCKQATVKAGQALSHEEMAALIRRLEGTASPRTCPHGRPTVIVMDGAQLARAFGRH